MPSPSFAINHITAPGLGVPALLALARALGLDAVDVPISNTFGPNTLAGFQVWTDEIVEPATT